MSPANLFFFQTYIDLGKAIPDTNIATMIVTIVSIIILVINELIKVRNSFK